MRAGVKVLCSLTAVFFVTMVSMVSSVSAAPADGQALYTTSFTGGVGAEWGSLAGSFTAYDSDGDSTLDALRQTGGEACTLVYLSQQHCTPVTQGLPFEGEYINDYQVVMHGKGTDSNADIGIAVRGNTGSALTFQYINDNFYVLKANAGGSYSFGTNFGAATNFIPGFNVTQTHEYKVRALDGNFEFRVDGVLIGTQSNPVVGGRTFDNSSTGTVGVAGWDAIIILDFEVKFIAGGAPLPTPTSPKGQIVLRQNSYDCGDFYLYVPTTATAANPLPLVITSHSTVTTADEEIGLNPDPIWGCCEGGYANTRWYQLAENNGNVNGHNQPFIVAAPAMTGANGGLVNPWTGESQSQVDEQRILAIYYQIVNYEASTFNFAVDTNRVLLTGWSGGGIPTYYTGVRHPEIFRMIVSRAGNWDSGMFTTAGDLTKANQLAIAIVQGSNDTVVPLSIHQAARDYFLAHGYLRTFLSPADAFIRIVPDAEFPAIPSNHYCNSLAAWDTFMDYCEAFPQVQTNDPSGDMTASCPITFSATATHPLPGATITNWLWDFSSGSSESGQTVQHIFHDWGLLRASITVTDSNGRQARAIRMVTVASGVADMDCDGDVDMEDFGHFQFCYSGSSTPPANGCGDADLDDDNDVDANDFAMFKACMAGPGRSRGC